MLSRVEERFIKEQLVLYGCTDREVEIYLHALQAGPSSVQDVAQILGYNRITIHSACAQLIKKGFLFETRKGKRRLLIAEEPEALFRLLKVKENELEVAKANLGYVVGLLSREHTPLSSTPTVQFHQGKDGFKRMLEMSLSAKKEFLGLINVDLFANHLTPAYLEDFFERRANLGIHSRLIWPQCGEFAKQILPKAIKYKTQIRVLPFSKEWRSGFISWNNSVSIKSFSAGQITCTIVENDDIASFYQDVIFESLWSNAKPLKFIRT